MKPAPTAGRARFRPGRFDGRRRARHPPHGPRQHDGRGPAVHLGGDLEDRQPPHRGDGRRCRAAVHRRLEAGRQGDRHLPRRLQAGPAAPDQGVTAGADRRQADPARDADRAPGDRAQVPGRRVRGLHPRRPVPRGRPGRHLRGHRQGGHHAGRPHERVHDRRLGRHAVRRAARGVREQVRPHALRAVGDHQRPRHPHREVDPGLHLPLDGQALPRGRHAGRARDHERRRTREAGQRQRPHPGRPVGPGRPGGRARAAERAPDGALQRLGGRGRVRQVRRAQGAHGSVLHLPTAGYNRVRGRLGRGAPPRQLSRRGAAIVRVSEISGGCSRRCRAPAPLEGGGT